MSSIEQLKAEATALREMEKARGNVLKHSDALEQIAKKHGYANWRAALAMLGGGEPNPQLAETPGKSAPDAEEIVASELQNGEFETARQSAFTRWMSPEQRQAAVEFSAKMGLLPVYAETSRDGTRYLFWHLPPGALCEVRSGRTKEQFLELHRANIGKGRRLMSLHLSVDQAYSAVWISPKHYGPAAEYLKRFGITVSP